MKPRATLVLIFVALVFGGFVALDYFRGTSTEEAQTKSKRVLDFQSKDISGVKIELTVRSRPAFLRLRAFNGWPRTNWPLASVITLKPAIRYQFKTGQRDWPKT